MRWTRCSAWVVLVVGMAGRATASVEWAAQPLPAGGQAITIELSGFTFSPDLVTLEARQPVWITAMSSSQIPPDITILSIEGGLLKRVDVPAKQTVAFDITLSRPARYVFYCSKFVHRRPFGMEGTFVAK